VTVAAPPSPLAPDDVPATAERLRAERRPFVLATVVRAERPTSAKPGDSAVVLDDGTVVGFVGGECAEASVAAQALAALRSDEPVLLRITPDAEPAGGVALAEAGAVTVHNPCLSGGRLEIFLEPALPPPALVVHGDAPIARAVRELAAWLGYAAAAWDPDAGLLDDTVAVVAASHGGGEGEVLRAAVRAGVPYVGLVASPRRGAAVLDALELAPDERARIDTPAGVDIAAATPREVALSIMTSVVARRPRASGGDDAQPASSPVPPAATAPVAATALDPVCGMAVAATGTRHLDHEGTRYWFCGAGCEQAFRADPASFLPS